MHKCAEAMAVLGPKHEEEGCQFANGHGYLWHDPASVEIARKALTEITESRIDGSCNLRAVCDSGLACLNSAWCRVRSISADGREWGQIYYANNPSEGEQICIEDRR